MRLSSGSSFTPTLPCGNVGDRNDLGCRIGNDGVDDRGCRIVDDGNVLDCRNVGDGSDLGCLRNTS